MGHAIHFLERLQERIADHQIQRALGLYYSSDRARFLIEYVLGQSLPEGQRVALALESDPETPYVVATGDGRMVTCLGAGMQPRDLIVISFVDLERAQHVYAQTMRLKPEWEAVQARDPGRKALSLIWNDAAGLTRSTFRGLLFLRPWLRRELVSRAFDVLSELDSARDEMTEVFSLMRKIRKLLKENRGRAYKARFLACNTLDAGRALSRNVWAKAWGMTHSLMLACAEDTPGLLRTLTRVPHCESLPLSSQPGFGWPVAQLALWPFFIRGVWLWAQCEGDALRDAERGLQRGRTFLEFAYQTCGLAVMSLRGGSIGQDARSLLQSAASLSVPGEAEVRTHYFQTYARTALRVADHHPDLLPFINQSRETITSIGRSVLSDITRRPPEKISADDPTLASAMTFAPVSLQLPSNAVAHLPLSAVEWLASATAEDFYLPDPFYDALHAWVPNNLSEIFDPTPPDESTNTDTQKSKKNLKPTKYPPQHSPPLPPALAATTPAPALLAKNTKPAACAPDASHLNT